MITTPPPMISSGHPPRPRSFRPPPRRPLPAPRPTTHGAAFGRRGPGLLECDPSAWRRDAQASQRRRPRVAFFPWQWPPGTGGSAHALTVPRWRRRRRRRRWRWLRGHWRLPLALALDGKLAHVRQEDQGVAIHGAPVGGGAACARAPRTPLALAASRGPLVLLLTQARSAICAAPFTHGPPPLY